MRARSDVVLKTRLGLETLGTQFFSLGLGVGLAPQSFGFGLVLEQLSLDYITGQETQLSLTNRATRLEVIQGHQT